MKRTHFDILEHLSTSKISEKVKELGAKKLTKTGHGFSSFGEISISESAQLATSNYSAKAKIKPAVALMDVVLAANRNYNKVVEPKIRRIELEHPDFKTFDQLNHLIKTKTKEEFYHFWGHKDDKKYRTLINILQKIDVLKIANPQIKTDYEVMHQWANNADLFNYKTDIIGSLPNIAVATFQHLRMVFGVNTIKPDQRVKEVLRYELGLGKLSDISTILAVEQIASIVNLETITIDQIFVKYGSSYYNQTSNRSIVLQIARKLKTMGVDSTIISKATLISTAQIEKL